MTIKIFFKGPDVRISVENVHKCVKILNQSSSFDVLMYAGHHDVEISTGVCQSSAPLEL